MPMFQLEHFTLQIVKFIMKFQTEIQLKLNDTTNSQMITVMIEFNSMTNGKRRGEFNRKIQNVKF